MAKKLAIDWDDSELRLVSAQCSGSNVKVTDAACIPIENGNVIETLRSAVQQRGLSKAESLVAIGRGKAELREMTLPPVPEEELPDMVRLQAIRSFASAGDSATVDFLVTNKDPSGTSVIAAAVGPTKLSEIQKACEASELTAKRIALRPLAASALYLAGAKTASSSGETVLIDLLSDDAEIVVVRDGKVIFVRTVRMPTVAEARSTALAGELRRSLVACGASGAPDRVVIWGRESVHQDDVDKIKQATGGTVDVVNPFDLVEVDKSLRDQMPEHVGRLAPLVGLLSSDETAGHLLVDFLNPRQRPEEEPETLKKALLIGVPIAAAVLLAFLVFQQLRGLDQEIASLTEQKEQMGEPVALANEVRARTESMDKFLDGDFNWLDEIRRLSESMPASEQLIVKSLVGQLNVREGSATMTVSGGVTDPDVIDVFEASLRDDFHGVTGDGTKDSKSRDRYRWTLNEEINIQPGFTRAARYKAVGPRAKMAKAAADTKENEPESGKEADAESVSKDEEAQS